MKIQRIAIGLTVVNLLLLLFLLAQIHRTTAQDVVPVLRGRALEIVDGQGRVRAEILVHGPERVGGKLYPETVLFRMADQNRRPVVKFTDRGTSSIPVVVVASVETVDNPRSRRSARKFLSTAPVHPPRDTLLSLWSRPSSLDSPFFWPPPVW